MKLYGFQGTGKVECVYNCLNFRTVSTEIARSWLFSLNFLPFVRAPIVSGHRTKNI